MPNSENDAQCVNKKRHIGNDAVHIVYNDSGQDYRNGLIKSQFNYASVVIKPIEHGENVVQAHSGSEQLGIMTEVLGHSLVIRSFVHTTHSFAGSTLLS